MKFDSRNPFAAWGHEEEIYTVSGENETIEITQDSKGFQNAADLTNKDLFVADAESDVKAVSQEDYADAQDVVMNFRSNNDEGLPSDMFKRRAVPGQDNEYKQSEDYNNTELNYYGNQAEDLKLYGEAEEGEEGGEGGGDNGNEGGTTIGTNTDTIGTNTETVGTETETVGTETETIGTETDTTIGTETETVGTETETVGTETETIGTETDTTIGTETETVGTETTTEP